jgi:KUP system potassium uptake protein
VTGVERVVVEPLSNGFHRVTARYGFMETPDVPEIIAYVRKAGVKANKGETTYYLGRERIIVSDGAARPGSRRLADNAPLKMARWRKKIFVVMARNARSATEFFSIPPNRVVELGAQVEL